jgi:predicted ATP-dependent endonuclease of OLD family
MILRRIQPVNWGAFTHSATLEVEEDVTILTAANDAGKSSLLRLIDAAYRNPPEILQSDFNLYHLEISQSTNWEQDPHFGCQLFLTATDHISKYITCSVPLQALDEISLKLNLAPKNRLEDIRVVRDGSLLELSEARLVRMPYIIGLPTSGRIRTVINLMSDNMRHAERLFLQAIFDVKNIEIVKNLPRHVFVNKMNLAQDRLNAIVAEFLPKSLGLSFELLSPNSCEIAIHVHDHKYGYAPLEMRGSGIQVLLSLLVSLLEINIIDEQLLVYIDEPEVSLHADAQHLLRSLLEGCGRHLM